MRLITGLCALMYRLNVNNQGSNFGLKSEGTNSGEWGALWRRDERIMGRRYPIDSGTWRASWNVILYSVFLVRALEQLGPKFSRGHQQLSRWPLTTDQWPLTSEYGFPTPRTAAMAHCCSHPQPASLCPHTLYVRTCALSHVCSWDVSSIQRSMAQPLQTRLPKCLLNKIKIKISARNFETAARQLFSSCAATQPHSLEGTLTIYPGLGDWHEITTIQYQIQYIQYTQHQLMHRKMNK